MTAVTRAKAAPASRYRITASSVPPASIGELRRRGNVAAREVENQKGERKKTASFALHPFCRCACVALPVRRLVGLRRGAAGMRLIQYASKGGAALRVGAEVDADTVCDLNAALNKPDLTMRAFLGYGAQGRGTWPIGPPRALLSLLHAPGSVLLGSS